MVNKPPVSSRIKTSKKLAQIQELKAAFPDASLPEIQSFIQDHLA